MAAVSVELQQERRLVCVEYPGVVRDVPKMLQTLGGEEGVSRIYADSAKRLELYFRPKDPYCHPVCANRFPTSSLLLKIKKKTRQRRAEGGGATVAEVKFDMEILGIITTVYKFQGMSDFQYLAIHTEAGCKNTSMYDKVLMLKPEKEEFFNQELPLYIPPPIFSRLDTPVDYFYRPETQHREGYNNPPVSGENLIGLSRARRPHNAIFVNFEDDEVPMKPLEAAVQTWKRLCTNPIDRKMEEELRKLFEIRPIWSRNAVKANISVHPDKLKVLLPYVAYYMITGPWRSLWIRYGYDPRKNPEAKIYQVLDFRIRCGMKYGYAPNDMPVKAKRSTYNYSLPITVKKTPSQLVTIHDLKHGLGTSGTGGVKKSACNKYKLKLGAVYTEGGFVEGVNKKLGLLGDSVDIFKGIPFAAPPKPLELPQRHPGWQGTLKAKEFKNRCLQATITQDDTFGSEDCLYLNIWIPQGRKQVSRDLPVMVWIYGGAFLMGAGHGANFLKNYLYDGEEIATRGNVIVVTFNYRVGPLGFLSTGDSNLPGNFGLWDQHMAIAWVKRNIAAFGGDPNNITIFGESAGGASVSLQTLTPHNKGLIKRAISQSGVALSPWVIQKNPLLWAKRIASKVGCPLDDVVKMAKCFKVTDPRALTLAYYMPLIGLEYPMLHYLGFIPVIDGDFIPDDPVKLFANAADIDYIAGTNNMDGHIFASIDMPAINKPSKDITDEDFYKLISGLTTEKGLSGANATFDFYTELWKRDSSQETKKKTVVDLETDILFLVPTEFALAQHKVNAK
ncbi:general transcription factor 3C polypeptide 5 isoform X1 [Macrotis lagotis]|uniref:general transcription factor 3C polypeptide 5 isoform X1 n=1 Tax=Macrotis lagotis TaxID=92651 RepID=UPI003D696761